MLWNNLSYEAKTAQSHGTSNTNLPPRLPCLLLDRTQLEMEHLETRRFHTKATLLYKILNDLSAPQLRNSFVKLNDTNITIPGISRLI